MNQSPLILSTSAIEKQMKIMQGLVSGMSLEGVLNLVLQGLFERFPDCIAGIWITEKERKPTVLSLLASIQPTSCCLTSITVQTGVYKVNEHDFEESVYLLLRENFYQCGMNSVEYVTILDTKSKAVGVLGIALPKSDISLAIKSLFLQSYTQVAGLAIEKENSNEENHFLAYYDYLTEIPNRRFFQRELSKQISDAMQSQHPLSLVLLDLNNFKYVNDTFGHAAGDEVLQTIAQRIVTMLDYQYTVARLGGDEFAFLFANMTGLQAYNRINLILETIKHPIVVQGNKIIMMASAGIVQCPLHGTTQDTLLRYADINLYEAKQSSQFCIKLYN